jgi:hypothetical protein
MKKISFCFLFLAFTTVFNGQWYEKRYNVNDINLLTQEQLNESLSSTRTDLIWSAGTIGIGGLLILLEEISPYELSEDPTIFEQIMGEKGMRWITIATGSALAAGGTIAAFVLIDRIGQIKSVMRNYGITGQIRIYPGMLTIREQGSYCPGITLLFNF